MPSDLEDLYMNMPSDFGETLPACHRGNAEKIAELEGELKRLKIEMGVRINPPSCFDHGFDYQRGWIGKNPERAHLPGYAAGTTAREAEVERRRKEANDPI